jgi:hypothetical protein
VNSGSGKDGRAAGLYAAALAHAPSIGDHMRIPGSQGFDGGVHEARALIEQASASGAGDARVQAARGNIFLRGGFVDLARDAYDRAALLDPRDAASRYALAEIATVMGDEATARIRFDEAFARQRLFSPPSPRAGSKHALVLGLAGPWPRNMPLDFVVDDARWTLHRWFLPDPERAARAIPRVDLIVNALGDSAAAAAALADAQAILAAHADVPSINAPGRLRGLGRDRLALTLAGIPGVRVPEARRVTHAALAASGGDVEGLGYPLLARPIDTHGGRGLERLDHPGELPAYLARTNAGAYDCSAYVDYRGPGGWFRKLRIMFIDGVAYPYHLAVDDRWMIHYYRTATTATPWMHGEEARFLAEPERVVAGWHDAVPAIAAALGLDYVGIDCAQLPGGTLLVFEADSAMLVHALDETEAGRAKRAGVGRIRAALMALFDRRAAAANR